MLPVEILGNVQFIGETLPKFRQKVSVFSERVRHRGDVDRWKSYFPQIYYGCGGGCGRDSASSGGSGRFI
ncbi:cyclic nucleotide gated channel 1 [Prunus dulcis]|uniref:Cyclic nucleotide gated channel 1 n=1 Tax=Prunus dulcis TaxID=3755 RepID=A0A4Y1RMC4_PRUDU|nr:cyclic nucleotide gated channel 1 [Prunus dulcis]